MIPKDFKFKTTPFKHQLEGIEYGLTHDKWLLSDSMGMGKSKIVIDIADIKNVKHCLIICCKNGLKWNWLNEVHTHSYEEGYILGQRQTSKGVAIGGNSQRLDDLNNIDNLPRFIITNIETLKYRIPTGEKVERKVKGKLQLVDRYCYPITEKLQNLCDNGKISMIVIDEAHRLRNEDSLQAIQILKIHSPIQIAITGTPVINSPLDIFMSLKWLGYEDRTFGSFKHCYCRLGGYNGSEILGYKNLEEITDVLDKMMLRRLKENVLDLPDKLFVDDYVEMSDKQKKIYKEAKGELLNNIDRIKKSNNPLTKFTRLRQATGYTGILSSTIKVSAKLDRMEEIVEDAVNNGDKVVVFSNWIKITNEALQRLKRYNPAVITGDTKDSDIPIQEDKFQNDDSCKVIIGTIPKMGEGFNLTQGSVICFIDEPWDMETKKQAIDRCHRIGSTKRLTIYSLITKGTIDEKVHNLVERKGEMFNILIDLKTQDNKNTLINYLLS